MALSMEPAWRTERRARILAAAAELFAHSAYDAVQMDDIARRAGIGKPTLYRYFSSKDELFLTIFEEALADLQHQLSTALAAPLAPAETLARMVDALVDVLGGQLAALRLLTGEHSQLAERWRGMFRSRRLPILEALRTVLVRGIASQDFRPVDLDLVPAMVIGMIRGGLMGAGEAMRDRLPQEALRDRLKQAARDMVATLVLRSRRGGQA
jgi:AcrR family transcriptional regulator